MSGYALTESDDLSAHDSRGLAQVDQVHVPAEDIGELCRQFEQSGRAERHAAQNGEIHIAVGMALTCRGGSEQVNGLDPGQAVAEEVAGAPELVAREGGRRVHAVSVS